MIKKREYNLDALRILACFMVVVLHTSAQNWNVVSFTAPQWQAFNLYNSAVRSAVPLFFMLSGKLFLSKASFSLKDFFLKNALKLALIYVLWSVLYAVDELGVSFFLKAFEFRTFATAVITSKYHLWYLPELLSVYLMFPVLFALKQVQNGKPLVYIAILIFLCTILRGSLLVLVDNAALFSWLGRVSFGMGYACGYFVLGHLLDQYRDRFKKIPSPVLGLAFALLVLITALLTHLKSLKTGIPCQDFYSYTFLTNYLEAMVLFLLFLRLPVHPQSAGSAARLTGLSRYTLFVYLIHPFLLEHLKGRFGLDTLSFSPWLSVPLIAAMVFFLSVGAAWIIDRIPGIRRLLL